MPFTQVAPQEDYLIVEQIKGPEKYVTAEGVTVYLPEKAWDTKTYLAKVLWVGPGRTTEEGKTLDMPYEKDQIILLSKYIGAVIEPDAPQPDGRRWLAIRTDDVIGVVEGYTEAEAEERVLELVTAASVAGN